MEIKTLDELRKAYPALCELLERNTLESATSNKAVVAKVRDTLKEELNADLRKKLEENEDRIRAELREQMEPDLSDANEKLESLRAENGELIEKVSSLEKEKRTLNESVSSENAKLRKDLSELTEHVKKTEDFAKGREARSYILEQLNDHPQRDTLTMMILGVKSDGNPHGVTISEETELSKSLKGTVAPASLEEATSTLARVRLLAKSMGVSGQTTRTGSRLDESEGAKSSGPSRLQALSGIK